jgi:hypothetical protein
VYGGISNIAKGATALAAAAAIATVTVTPGTSNRVAGQTVQYAAELKDAAGNVLSGRTVAWSSSNNAVAGVDAAGLATASAPGSTTITASAEGKSGTAQLVVAGPAPGAVWPNEPAGFTTFMNQPFDALTGQGWNVNYNEAGRVSIINDPTAPSSPSGVAQFRYPIGYTGGGAPGLLYYTHPAYKDVYAGFWWKPSNPWQNHPGSNVNKIGFWYTPTWGSSVDIQMYGPAPYVLHVVAQFPTGTIRMVPNVTTTPVALGQWHRIELHFKYASAAGASDGVVEFWMDGVLQGRYTNVRTPGDAGFNEFQLSPTWGGLDGTKTENDYYQFDHVKLSRR